MVGWEEAWYQRAVSLLRALAGAKRKASNLDFLIISQIFIKLVLDDWRAQQLANNIIVALTLI